MLEGLMPELHLNNIVNNLIYVTAAFLLTLPVGLNRERTRQLGLRTIPLVAVAACGFMLLGRSSFHGDANAQARIVQGLITGVGFLGGGAIVKRGDNVEGTATAAAIWCTAAIGVACAFGRFEIAVLLAVFNFGILVLLKPVGKKVGDGSGYDAENPEESSDNSAELYHEEQDQP